MADPIQQSTGTPEETRLRLMLYQRQREVERLEAVVETFGQALRAAGDEIRALRSALGLSPIIREPAND